MGSVEFYEVLHGILEASVWIVMLLIPLVIGVYITGLRLKGIQKELKEIGDELRQLNSTERKRHE